MRGRFSRKLQGRITGTTDRMPYYPKPITIEDSGGQKGLQNIGATCYLNSIIQSLRFIVPFQSFISDVASTERSVLAKELAVVIRELQGGCGGSVNPRAFVVPFIAATKGQLRLGVQADAEEALHLLLDLLHVQIARPVCATVTGSACIKRDAMTAWAASFEKAYSPLVEIFFGQTQTRLICESCRHETVRYEPWDCLSLEIPGAQTAGSKAPTLDDCLSASFGGDEVIEDYTCDGCKSKGGTHKQVLISRFPEQLILSLKRFTNTGSKVQGRIAYDPDLVDLGAAATFFCEGPRYRVMSTVEHLGSSQGGHYCMRHRDSSSSSQWTVFDDTHVYSSPTGGNPEPGTYLLFMERISAMVA